MNLIAVVTPELADAIGKLALALPDDPVVKFLSSVEVGGVIISEPASSSSDRSPE